MKLKDMKEKHEHKFTDLLKVGIFALLMIAPLFASVSQMLYATFNKNAHQSYYGQTINEESYTYINNKNDMLINEKYYFNNKLYDSEIITGKDFNGSSDRLIFTNVKVLFNSTNFNLPSIMQLSFWKDTNANFFFMYGYDEEGNTLFSGLDTRTNNIIFEFTCLQNNLANNVFEYTNCFYKTEYNKYSYLDNAFYYGVDQMTKSDLFNWTQNTAIYTGVKAMTDNLQIQTPAIAILIVYWFILTIIYIIIDIVIKCFTAITHLI